MSDGCDLHAITEMSDCTLQDVCSMPSYSLKSRLSFCYHVVNAVAYLHSKNYLHLNIKLTNIHIQNDTARLSGFERTIKVRNAILDPRSKIDITALGDVISTIMLCGSMPSQRRKKPSGPAMQFYLSIEDSLASLLGSILKSDTKLTSMDILNDRTFDSVRINGGSTEIISSAEHPRYIVQSGLEPTVGDICDLIFRMWPKSGVVLIYRAVDIFICSAVHTSDRNVYRLIAASSVWIAYKMSVESGCDDHQARSEIVKWSMTTSRNVSDMECKIYCINKGNIASDYLYEACQGYNHYAGTYVNIIRRDNLRSYMDVDVDRWIKLLGPGDGDHDANVSYLSGIFQTVVK